MILRPNKENNNTIYQFDDGMVFHSGGFFLSGISNGVSWGNGVADAFRVVDYLPGSLKQISPNVKPNIFRFQNSKYYFYDWVNWKAAVQQGANFYDGDGDGFYNPVDKNNNNQWDNDEDKPDFLSQYNLWYVYNDGVPPELRLFSNRHPVQPQGIEIHQTVFATPATNYLNNVIFIRYRLINTGSVAAEFDSCYFTIFLSPEIGFDDDVIGCDTLLNAGYVYNKGYDSLYYGANPPCVMTQLLQGPVSFIPNISYIDKNVNNIFEPYIDISLDTAYNYKGLLGIDTIVGASNLSMSSFVCTICSHSQFGRPYDVYNLRLMQSGRDRFGNKINPCLWNLGYVFPQSDCNKINPSFIYSGDPVLNKGWICKYDKNCLYEPFTNVGPFKLIKNKPQDIIVAYIVGRGTDSLNSITETKRIAQNCQLYFKKNFGIDIPDKNIENGLYKYKFSLFQNYPNPFNPSTKISYQISKQSSVTLKVFDVLGNEVATLVNEEKQPGSYEVEFNSVDTRKASSIQSGVQYASGVYFYQLRAGSYTDTRKMIYMK
jgi:hypothetical protein